MILDQLKNACLYTPCHENFDFAFGFIEDAVRENFEPGKYELWNTSKSRREALWLSVQEYETKPREERKFEGHQKYIDIQYIVSGREEMEVCDLSRMKALTEYDSEKDCQFFSPEGKTTRLVLQAGDFALFFPDDIHMPGISPEGEAVAVKKIVAKIRIR